MQNIDRYAVMGNPIAHSKSPLIHRLFAEQTGQRLRYDAILVEPDRFRDAVATFAVKGGKGLNITVPFKQEACALANQLTARAERAGAVNTLVIHADGALLGDNTDGVGLLRDLTVNLGIAVTSKTVLILGAGGAARGVLGPLLERKPARLVIANRTGARALELAETFRDLDETIIGCGFGGLQNPPFDVVINATAAGLSGEVPALPRGVIATHTSCYDMMYGTEPTAFMRYAHEQGAAATFDGLGMLVEQAAESFHIWRGVFPETAPVIARLRKP
jgi:shikimate dehydrogenase